MPTSISGAVAGDGHKTSILGDCVKKCQHHSRTKHIDIHHHFLRDHELKGDIAIRHVSTNKQLADIFTKPLDETRFCALRSELNILDSRNLA